MYSSLYRDFLLIDELLPLKAICQMEQQKSGEKYRHGHHRVHGSFNSATLIQPTPIKLIAKGPYNTNRRHSAMN